MGLTTNNLLRKKSLEKIEFLGLLRQKSSKEIFDKTSSIKHSKLHKKFCEELVEILASLNKKANDEFAKDTFGIRKQKFFESLEENL